MMRVAALTLVLIPLAFAEHTKVPVTEISADMGRCSASFHVTDMAGEPLYNVTISTTIRHGFLNRRKLELQAGTNSDGRARFVKLPNHVKNPIVFTVTNSVDTATRSYDPGTNCHAEYNIPLQTKQEAPGPKL
ncbi:MAG: hypothetical protein ACE14L_02885 [Terriglobales bacterium]